MRRGIDAFDNSTVDSPAGKKERQSDGHHIPVYQVEKYGTVILLLLFKSTCGVCVPITVECEWYGTVT